MNLKNLTPQKAKFILYIVQCELARRNFWYYCQILSPDFYVEERVHLKVLCESLQALYEGKLLSPEGIPYRKMMINIPPQHGKSRTLINFCQWILGKNNEERIIQCSYNDTAAHDFARYTRDGIQEVKLEDEMVYSDIFPTTKIKHGDASYEKWALEGQHFNYLGAGIGGSITGKGGTVLIVDDPVKSAEIAFNENALEKIWQWYTGTFLSRVAAKDGEPIEIIVMTRWAKKDLCGYILNSSEASKWFVIKYQAYNSETDSMLCPTLLSKHRYETLKKLQPPEILEANYNQEPIDVKGRLYTSFKTYAQLPTDDKGNSVLRRILNYTDTADEGEDFLCSICYGEFNGEAYVLDVIYTKKGMEITEPLTADMLYSNNVNVGTIESNNGGRGFARNVERLLWEKYKTRRTQVKWFHQSQNKMARILTNSSFVQNHIYFPLNWADRWPEFYKALTGFQKEGKNKNDDAPDAITGVAESLNKQSSVEILR